MSASAHEKTRVFTRVVDFDGYFVPRSVPYSLGVNVIETSQPMA